MDPVTEVIALLKASGFTEDGETRSETVRVPTMRSPVSNRGKSGGELRKFGGRKRFVSEVDDGLKVTVGKRAVYFYASSSFGKRFATKEIAAIKEFVEYLKKTRAAKEGAAL